MFQGQQGGVTQLAFSPDGTKLYSGGRKAGFEIIFWLFLRENILSYTRNKVFDERKLLDNFSYFFTDRLMATHRLIVTSNFVPVL